MSVNLLKNYINGQWVEAEYYKVLDVENPSTGESISQVPLSTAAETQRAIQSAYDAFPSWAQTPVSARCNYLFKLRELIDTNIKEIYRLICEEEGKSIPDAEAEAKRLLQNVEVACGMPTLIKGEKVVGVAKDIDTETIRLPIGIFAMIAPFNFPAMVPFWFLPYAVAAGNTYIVKPSEQVPSTMQYIFHLIDEAGFPNGVINLVNGDHVVVDTLLNSPLLKGISFVGSSKVAHKVIEQCAKTGKRCQVMGGAKNYLVVMPDANMEKAIANMITSCFGCAGERCMAASVITCVGEETYEKTKRMFIEAADKMAIGCPLDPGCKDKDVLMGPVVSLVAKKRILECIEIAKKEGCKILLDKSSIVVKGYEKGYFIGPVILGNVKPGSATERTEIFGPVVSMMKVDSLDEVLEYLRNNPYGNGATIYTQSGYWARKFEIEAECGMIGINVGVPAPVAYFPFGGMKESQLSDIKAQGSRVVHFFTEEKIITRRFFKEDK